MSTISQNAFLGTVSAGGIAATACALAKGAHKIGSALSSTYKQDLLDPIIRPSLMQRVNWSSVTSSLSTIGSKSAAIAAILGLIYLTAPDSRPFPLHQLPEDAQIHIINHISQPALLKVILRHAGNQDVKNAAYRSFASVVMREAAEVARVGAETKITSAVHEKIKKYLSFYLNNSLVGMLGPLGGSRSFAAAQAMGVFSEVNNRDDLHPSLRFFRAQVYVGGNVIPGGRFLHENLLLWSVLLCTTLLRAEGIIRPEHRTMIKSIVFATVASSTVANLLTSSYRDFMKTAEGKLSFATQITEAMILAEAVGSKATMQQALSSAKFGFLGGAASHLQARMFPSVAPLTIFGMRSVIMGVAGLASML